jgi:mRNA-degrading endonuclease RelE of RelBE toxin-antitoxin system
MSDFALEFAPAALRDLHDVDIALRARVIEEIGQHLSANPFPRGKQIKRLSGFRIPTYELRVQGAGRSYRVVYRIEGRRVFVLTVPPRKVLDRYLRRFKEDLVTPYAPGTTEALEAHRTIMAEYGAAFTRLA